MRFLRLSAVRFGAVCLLLGLGQARAAAPASLEVTGLKSSYDDVTKETILTGDARLVNGDTVLTADEIRYDSLTGVATATGHFVLTSGRRRLVADTGTYNILTRALNVRNLRVGEFPVYLTGDQVEGTLDELRFTNATVFFRENAGYTPSLYARHLTYGQGKILHADGLSLGLLGGHFLSIPSFERAFDTSIISYIKAEVGYRGNLGAFTELGLHLPVAPGIQAGADLGLFTARGIMIGPSGSYNFKDADSSVQGTLHSGYINDHGDRGTDVLGQPVPADRGYVTWEHRQSYGEHFTLNGEYNYWSDSEVMRDFQHKSFDLVQQPDSFLEGAYSRDNYTLSAFARVNPNDFFRVQERLPELRFDLLPSAVALGVYQRLNLSAAALQADAYGTDPALRTNRLDGYYGLERTFGPVSWFSFTPVAGGRITYYSDALGGKDTYTRTIGEVGFDARLLGSGTFDYKNEVWEIDGLRHLVEPKLSYRYAPEAAQGLAYIPPIDTQAFTTYLPPLSIADSRNIDELEALNTLRLTFANTLQTRDPTYGSRNLATLNFSADYRFDLPGKKPLSDIYTELALTPAPWLRWELFHRFDPHSSSGQELNTALELIDQQWWSARVSTHYLKDNYEEYYLEYRQRINEVFDVTARWRYDAINDRFNEQTYGFSQRLGQTWALKYEVSWFDGPRRESAFALNVEVELLKF